MRRNDNRKIAKIVERYKHTSLVVWSPFYPLFISPFSYKVYISIPISVLEIPSRNLETRKEGSYKFPFFSS